MNESRSTNRQGNVAIWLLGIALVICLAGIAAYLGRGLYDIGSGGSITSFPVSSFGQNWTVTIPAGTSTGSAAGCTATTSLSGVGFTGSIKNAGNQCAPQTSSGVVSLDSVDLKNVRHAVIGRSCTMSVGEAGSNGASITSTIQGLSEPNIQNGDLINARNAQGSTGTIFIDNDGSVLTIRSGSYTQTFDGTVSQRLSLAAGINSNGLGDITCQVTSVNISTLAIPAPSPQAAPSLGVILGTLVDWIVGFFKALYGFDIGGPTTVVASGTYSYHINLMAPYTLQNDSTQGVFMQRWCDNALITKTGSIIQDTGFTTCADAYNVTPSFTIPTGTLQDYAVVAVMVETRQDYVNGTWSTTYSQRVIQKESLTITDKVLSSPTPASQPSGFLGFLTSIWSWLKGLWPL